MNSSNINVTQDNDGWPIEKQEWLEALFARDVNGVMQRRMDQAVDGDYQMYSVLPGEEVREHWTHDNPELAELMKDEDIGKYVVPIVPDEARTFGMDDLFRQVGIYSSEGQLYQPEEETRIPYLSQVLEGCSGKFVAASDYMKVLPASVARWVPGDLVCLGTDGYGLSESRPVIRDHFGVSAEYIIRATGGEA